MSTKFFETLPSQIMTDHNNDPSHEIVPTELHAEDLSFTEEVLSKDSNVASFVYLPFSTKSISQLEKMPSSMNNSLKLHKSPINISNSPKCEGKLKNVLNKIYYKKVRTLLNEHLEGVNDGTMINIADLNSNFEDNASPKTRYHRDSEKPLTTTSHLLYLEKKDRYEALWSYTDKYPCLKCRVALLRTIYRIQAFCYKTITNKYFEYLSLLIILWNTIMLLLDDPTSQNDVGNMFDEFFLIFYTIEMALKIMGLGFLLNKDAYLRSGWNWLDMTIVVTGFLPYVIASDNNMKISVLRTLRVIRPLKTITSLKNLMMIVMTLFSAFPYILNTLLILFFFLLIYAIVATQLLEGTLKRRCFNQITGLMIPQITFQDSSYNGVLCGYDECPNSAINICGKMFDNPNSNITNFDNFLWSFLMMIQEITLENWSYNMYYVARTTHYYAAVIVFVSLAFIGAFILLNLMASVITNSYHEQAEININKNKKEIRLYNADVQEYLQYNKEDRVKRKYMKENNMGKKYSFGLIRLQEVMDLKNNSPGKAPQEYELEKETNSLEKYKIYENFHNKNHANQVNHKNHNDHENYEDYEEHHIDHDDHEDNENHEDHEDHNDHIYYEDHEDHENHEDYEDHEDHINHVYESREDHGDHEDHEDHENHDLNHENHEKHENHENHDNHENHINHIIHENHKNVENPKIPENNIVNKNHLDPENYEIHHETNGNFENYETNNEISEYNNTSHLNLHHVHSNKRPLNNMISIEELSPLFENKKVTELCMGISNHTNSLMKANTKTNSNSGGKLEEEAEKGKNLQAQCSDPIFSLEITEVKRQTSKQSQEDTFQELNQLKKLNSINERQESVPATKDHIPYKDSIILENHHNNGNNHRIKWLNKLKLNNLFSKAHIPNIKDKFKDFKLKVDHTIEYVSNSACDVIQESLQAKKQKEEIIFDNKLKNCKFEVIYRIRQNFELNKKEIKAKHEKDLIKKYMELDTKIGNTLIKDAFFHLTPNQIKLPLSIQLNSFVFLIKMENLFDKNRKSKGKAFNYFANKQKPFGVVKKKKRQGTINFSSQEIKYSMAEILSVKKEDSELMKEFTNEQDYKNIRVNDYETRRITENIEGLDVDLYWSGKEVLDYLSMQDMKKVIKSIKQENQILKALTTKEQDHLIWMQGFFGKVEMLKKIIRDTTEGKLFEYTIFLVVILNTVCLSMIGYLTQDKQINILESINLYVTYVFITELLFKIFGFGFIEYVKNSSNLLDAAIVVISVVDIIESSMNYKMNIIRSLRIIRVTRILRPLKYMKVITKVVVNKFYSFIYICLLLVLFIIIYTLIGNQIYINQLNNNATGIRQTFDNFYFSFLSVFQLVTIENWNDIETITLNSSVPTAFTIFYLLSLIFFGNYIFLNLFLGVLLEGFSNISSLDLEEEENPLNLEEIMRFNDNSTNGENRNKNSSNFLTTLDEEEIDHFLNVNKCKKKAKTFDNPWEEWHCEESLWIFTKDSFIRKIFFMIVSSKYFKYLIFFLILINSIKLAVDTYITTDQEQAFSEDFDFALGSCLVMEALMKIISYGMVFDQNTYLRDQWNVLDFLVVIASVIDMSLTNYNLHYLKIFLLIRVLKLLSLNSNMKLVVSALIKSIGPLFNLIIFVFIIFLIFALIGMSLLSGRLGYCNVPSSLYYGYNKATCLSSGYQWQIANANFDNVFNAMITVFILCTQENWPNIMYTSMDGNTDDIGPNFNAYKYIGIYFVISLAVLNFFLINLFVGVLCDQFVEAKEKYNPYNVYDLTENQRLWLDFLSYLLKVKPKAIKPLKTNEKCRGIFKKIIKSNIFEIFLIICIMMNIIVLGMTYEGEPDSYTYDLELVNYIITGVFILEAFLKILALGIKDYFSSNWNFFDFFIVATSIAEIIIDKILQSQTNSINFLRIGPQIIRIFRIMRVLRVIKLIKRLETFKKLIGTLISALPSIMNVGLLYFMVFYIYAVIGVILFKDVRTGVQIDDYNNFHNVGLAIILCFKMVTGENWWQFMFDCYKVPPYCDPAATCGSVLAPLYFISFQVIAGFIVQSLFILVILQTLEKANEQNSLNQFKELSKKFKETWIHYATFENPDRVKSEKLIDFFKHLSHPIGMKGKLVMDIAIEIMKMNLESDHEDNAYFYDVFLATLKRVYGIDVESKAKEETLNYIAHTELLIREKIYGMQRRCENKRKSAMNFGDFSARTRKHMKKKKTANPMVKLLYLPMIFKGWRVFARKKLNGELSFDEKNESPIKLMR